MIRKRITSLMVLAAGVSLSHASVLNVKDFGAVGDYHAGHNKRNNE